MSEDQLKRCFINKTFCGLDNLKFIDDVDEYDLIKDDDGKLPVNEKLLLIVYSAYFIIYFNTQYQCLYSELTHSYFILTLTSNLLLVIMNWIVFKITKWLELKVFPFLERNML